MTATDPIFRKLSRKECFTLYDCIKPLIEEVDGGSFRYIDGRSETAIIPELAQAAGIPHLTAGMVQGLRAELFGPLARVAIEPVTGMSFAAFSAANRRRCEAPEGFNHPIDAWDTSDWFLATVGELGEAANVAKKLNRIRDGITGNNGADEAVLREKLRKELADTFIYLDLIAQHEGFDLGSAVIEKFNEKSAEIGYPERVG